MRKRSKYRPKGVRIDNIAYVMSGIQKFDDVDTALTLRLKNHTALDLVCTGKATKAHIDILIGAFNMVEALARLRDEMGADWVKEIQQAQDALLAVAQRGVATEHFICRGPEMVALKLAMEIHDAQLDAATVLDIERAVDLIEKEIRGGKARPIVKLTVAA
jgi:hypothetical protein